MKNFLKHFKGTDLLILLIFLAALFVRFYNFENRVVYGPEQAISLISASENLQKPSLLGIPYLLRETAGGLRLFTAPVFGYTLVPLILLFHFDIFKITSVFVLINVLTGLALYLVSKKIFGKSVAVFATTLFLFSDYMVYHSLFIWTSNYMPCIGIVSFYLIYKFMKESKNRLVILLLGIVSGIGFGIQYFYVLGILIVLAFILKFSKRKIYDIPLFVGGFLIGELPTVLFDVKHSFYHAKTLFSYFTQILTVPGQSQLSYYHFLFFWPIAAVFLGLLVFKIYKKNRNLAIILTLFYVVLNLLSPRISFGHAIGMPEGLAARDILSSAEALNNDGPDNFNVSVLMDFDFRGYVLRYPLRFLYGRQPLSVESYPDAETLYVLAPKDYNFAQSGVWEVSAGGPYETRVLSEIEGKYALYKLIKK